MTNFEQVTKEIQRVIDAWVTESHKQVWNKNQAAGKRARKLSVELEKLMKQWRALSTGREQVTE